MTASERFRPVDREQLADQVIGRLREHLTTGHFRAGDKFPSVPELMKQLSVGRTTVREAIRALVYAGYLQVKQGDGTYVRTLTPNSDSLAARLTQAHVAEVYELRRTLELEMVRLAALRREDGDLRQLAGALRQMKANVDPGEEAAFLAADVDFHLAVAAATHNDLLLNVYSDFAPGLRQALGHVVTLPNVVQNCLATKTHVFQAIKARNANVAQQHASRHLEQAIAMLERLMADDSRGTGSRAAGSKKSRTTSV